MLLEEASPILKVKAMSSSPQHPSCPGPYCKLMGSLGPERLELQAERKAHAGAGGEPGRLESAARVLGSPKEETLRG